MKVRELINRSQIAYQKWLDTGDPDALSVASDAAGQVATLDFRGLQLEEVKDVLAIQADYVISQNVHQSCTSVQEICVQNFLARNLVERGHLNREMLALVVESLQCVNHNCRYHDGYELPVHELNVDGLAVHADACDDTACIRTRG